MAAVLVAGLAAGQVAQEAATAGWLTKNSSYAGRELYSQQRLQYSARWVLAMTPPPAVCLSGATPLASTGMSAEATQTVSPVTIGDLLLV